MWSRSSAVIWHRILWYLMAPRAQKHSDMNIFFTVHLFFSVPVMAACSIANIVKSSLGPVGLDKMLVDDIGVCIVLGLQFKSQPTFRMCINPLNAELNPICCLLTLLGAHHILHVSRIRVKSLTLRLLISYIYIYIYIWSTYSWCF